MQSIDTSNGLGQWLKSDLFINVIKMATKRKITINRKPKATVEEVKIEVEKVEPETEQEVEPEVNVEEVMEEVKEEVKKIQQRDVMGTI